MSIDRQRRGKQASSKIQGVFSVGSVQSGYKRDEFRSWQLWKYRTVVGREWVESSEMARNELDCAKKMSCAS
jgi:hypothetical protein